MSDKLLNESRTPENKDYKNKPPPEKRQPMQESR